MQREHGACPLHRVRMRWQWSHALLTRRLTGADCLRSDLLMSTACVSIAVAVGRKFALGRS